MSLSGIFLVLAMSLFASACISSNAVPELAQQRAMFMAKTHAYV